MDTAAYVAVVNLPTIFQQDKHPKVFTNTFAPTNKANEELNCISELWLMSQAEPTATSLLRLSATARH
jgi:hypothetical protein